MSSISKNETEQELLSINQKLLNSIISCDWSTYKTICHPSLTCIEAETRGEVVDGLEFHKFYFDNSSSKDPSSSVVNVTMASPKVRILGVDGNAAVMTYMRLTQVYNKCTNQYTVTSREEETRVYEKIDGKWWHVHFHRSKIST